MRSIGNRLLALEGGLRGQFDDLSDGELAERLNEIYSQLRSFGYDFADIYPPNPSTLELQMMITQWLHGEESDPNRFQDTENTTTEPIGVNLPDVRHRIVSLEQKACAGFAGFVVICSWQYDTATSEDAIAQYVAANGLGPDGKLVVFMGLDA